MSNPTIASIIADVEATERVARGRGSPACDHLAGRLASIRGELQQIAEPQPGADAHAAQVLAAHNEWRRFNGETGGPGAPEMGDPAEIGRAIDHVVSRLRAAPQPPAEAPVCTGDAIRCHDGHGCECAMREKQPPAEAQAVGGDLLPCPMCGESAAVNTCRTNDREFIRLNKRDTGYGVNCIACGLNNRGVAYGYATAGEAIAGWNRRTAPPSAPVGVDVLEARLEAAERANEALRIDVAEAHNVRRQVQEKNRELSAALSQQPTPVAPVGVEAGWYRYNKPAPRWEDTKFGKWLDPAVYGPPREQHGYSLEVASLSQQPAAVDGARPLDDWHEDDGPVVWWKLPVDEPAWIGTPLDSDWPEYHTHWTPHPAVPALAAQPQENGNGE
ncbi:hypothetical protein WCE55_02365 [Luteimonas sp. MJ293]|uniref:Lar family restriction alleviation protein n=1 Tax=Luteimonas sp. MJ146 TaxID=3129240 RepID=UPI0031BBAD89